MCVYVCIWHSKISNNNIESCYHIERLMPEIKSWRQNQTAPLSGISAWEHQNDTETEKERKKNAQFQDHDSISMHFGWKMREFSKCDANSWTFLTGFLCAGANRLFFLYIQCTMLLFIMSAFLWYWKWHITFVQCLYSTVA